MALSFSLKLGYGCVSLYTLKAQKSPSNTFIRTLKDFSIEKSLKLFNKVILKPCQLHIKSPIYQCTVYTVCPRSLDPIYIVIYFINWVKTSYTDSKKNHGLSPPPPCRIFTRKNFSGLFQTGRSMVLILDGCSSKESSNPIFFRRRPTLLYSCAVCSVLPSYISGMGRRCRISVFVFKGNKPNVSEKPWRIINYLIKMQP